MQKKRIGVYFDDPAFDDYPFTIDEYRKGYLDLACRIHNANADFAIVRSQESYLGSNEFQGGWIYTGEKFVRTEERITLDIIFNKGHFLGETSASVLNDPAFDALCTDKWASYQLAPEHFPLTFLVQTPEELREALSRISSPLVVAKPLDQSQGRGVFIGARKEVEPQIDTFPYLVQAFIDGSRGIPGLVEGIHDFRMIVIRGAIFASYIRTPPGSELIANVALGGIEIDVPIVAIPKEARAIFDAIDAHLQHVQNRLYSIDLARDIDGVWKIIELNSQPGSPSPSSGNTFDSYQNALSDLLMTA